MSIVDEVVKYYVESGEGTRKVGKKFGISKDMVNKYVREAGVVRKNHFLTYDKRYFQNIDTEHKAYWLGFIMADGNIYDYTKRPKYSLDIALSSKDRNHLEKFKDDIKYTGQIRERLIQGKYLSSRLQLHGKEIVSDLTELGCGPNKTAHVDIPDIPKELLRHFIRGYFDGDGSISIYNDVNNSKNRVSISICCGNETFLEKLQAVFIRHLGISKVNIYKDKRSSLREYRKQRSEAMKILNWLYEESTIYLDRKYEKYKESCRLYSETI